MITTGSALLGPEFPLPLDLPFTFRQAQEAGISRRQLSRLTRDAWLRRLLPGVYVAAQAPDSQILRSRAIRLLVPEGHVVTDESAGWLAGASMILRPGAHLAVPPVSVFGTAGSGRLRNGIAISGTRDLLPADITEYFGVPATTPLRTALDLGRLQHRDRAIAAIDQLLRLGEFDLDQLLEGVPRFKGFRGVRQLRWLAPLGNGLSESPGESALRLRFLEAGLSSPTPQFEIYDGGRFLARGDLVLEELRFLAEYDGEEWHGPERKQADEDRLERVRNAGWTVRSFRRHDVFGRTADAGEVLRDGVREARRSLGLGGEPENRG
jgi:hypothetical protein